MLEHMLRYPIWLQAWIAWMGAVNLAAVLFLRHREGRITLAAFAAAAATMQILVMGNGFNRLLGLGHVLFWTPLVVYLVRARPRLDPGTPLRLWVTVLLATNATSLLVDYLDVARYLLGER